MSLGELFKIRNNNNSAKNLLADLLEELKVNLTLIEKGVPLRKGFWILGIRSGRAEFLGQEERRNLWEIYSRITHYNKDLQHVHQATLIEGGYEVPPNLRNELDEFCNEIRDRIREFLATKKV